MRLISWNVNGLRACVQKGFLDVFRELDADCFCLQETKLQPDQIDLELIGFPELDNEGRVITAEFPEFYLVTCYTPNAQRGLARLDHRMRWDEAFRSFLKELDERKGVIVCGDLNVAHQEIDLKNPKSNRGNAGFSDEERESFTKLLDAGFTDTFRYKNPDATGCYTWWSYMYKARQNNAGWRIDYFLVSDRLRGQIKETPIYHEIQGSDHCPVGLELQLED